MPPPWGTGAPPWGYGPPSWVTGQTSRGTGNSDMNVTLDDTSSQFTWSNWAQSTNSWSSSSAASGYYDSTYHSTSTANDQADIFFQGTAIYLYGAKHGDPGGHTVCRMDNGNPNTFDEPPIGSLQQVLCAFTGLDPSKQHHLNWAANVGAQGTTFDIDYAVITPNVAPVSGASGAGVAPTSTTPSGVSLPLSPSPSAPSSSASTSSLSSIPLNLSPALSVQSSAGSSVVSMTSGTATSSTGAGGAQGNSQESGAPHLGPNSAGNANPAATSDESSSKSSTGAIAGGVAGGAAAVALIAFLLWWFFCRRKRLIDERVDPLVESKPLDLAEGGSPNWALPTYAQSQGVAGSVYYTSPISGPGEARTFTPGSDHPFLSPATAPAVRSAASYPYSVNPPSTAASSGAEPFEYRNPFWSGLSPPATPSSRQGAASRAASVPQSATSRNSSQVPRSEKSVSLLPYRSSAVKTAETAAPSNVESTITNPSYKQLYQKWNERNKEATELSE